MDMEELESDTDIIQDVMATMGWQNSFMPIASEENKNLMIRIKFLGRTKLDQIDYLEEKGAESAKAGEQLRTVEYEFDQNLKLINAHKSQFNDEHHLYKLSEHEESKFKDILKEITKQDLELKAENQKLMHEKTKVNGSIEKLTETVQWAKNALAEWREVTQSNEARNKMIEKFIQMDSGHAETLDAKRKLVHDAIIKQQVVLFNAFEEKRAVEKLLEKTSKLYRQAHIERRHLVSTWKDAVNQMNQRENDIKSTEAEIIEAYKVTNEKREHQKREEETLKLKQDDNREIEFMIQELNITSSDLRSRSLRLESANASKSSELLAVRKTVQHESQKLNNLRAQNRQLLIEEKEKENLLKTSIEDMRALREKYDKFKTNNSNAQERLRQIDEMLEGEKKNIKTIESEVDRLSSALFRTEQQLKKLQDAEKDLELEGQALDNGITRTRTSCKGLEKELLRQTEILYHVDYKIQHGEMRIASMQGTFDEEETKRLEEKCEYLRRLFDDKERAEELMKTQIARIEEDLKKLSIVYQNSIGDYEKIKERLKERKLFVEGGEKQQKIIHQQNQELLVDQNLLRIRIAQLEKQIEKQADKAFSLERHKMELEAAMHDRLIDIKSQSNLLNMKRKCLIEEKAQLRCDVADRLMKIERLSKRYELENDLLGKNEDGTIVTAVQIKVEMAQEKFMLLNSGNELNERICKAEKEIKCMENTLKLMRFCNDEYRQVFEVVTEASPEIIKMNQLQMKYSEKMTELKVMKNNLIMLIDQYERLEHQREHVEKEFEEVQRRKLDNNDTLLKIHKELCDQENKLERADRELKMAFKTAKRRIKDHEFMSHFEKDLRIKESDEKNDSAMQQIAELVENTPEAAQTVTRHFLERGLSLPSAYLTKRSRSHCSWMSDTSINHAGDRAVGSDLHCSLKKYSLFSHRSIMSGSSAGSSSTNTEASSHTTSRESLKVAAVPPGLSVSVVNVSFPKGDDKNVKKSRKAAATVAKSNQQS